MSSAPNPENKMTKVNDEDPISCCGLAEIASIGENANNPEETIKIVCRKMYEQFDKAAFLVFSDIKKKEAGKNLARYITKNKLGIVQKSPSRINTNSKNSLAIWTWTINKRNLYNYWRNYRNQ